MNWFRERSFYCKTKCMDRENHLADVSLVAHK